MNIQKISFRFAITSTAMLILSGCAWHDTTRVDTDFGNSVRVMVAEQIFAPEAAHEPPVYGPSILPGNAADAAISGYEKASREARVQRERSTNSPIPVVGIISGADE